MRVHGGVDEFGYLYVVQWPFSEKGLLFCYGILSVNIIIAILSSMY